LAAARESSKEGRDLGGIGLIGSTLVAELGRHGHEAVSAVPDTGVNSLTGEGLAEALEDGGDRLLLVGQAFRVVQPPAGPQRSTLP
jgi:hypothetical protein